MLKILALLCLLTTSINFALISNVNTKIRTKYGYDSEITTIPLPVGYYYRVGYLDYEEGQCEFCLSMPQKRLVSSGFVFGIAGWYRPAF